MAQRSRTADLLKGIAVILMIQVHIVELFATPKIFSSTIGQFLLFLGGPLVAPIFVGILGYYIGSSQKTTKQLIWRGIKIFLAGMLLNILLNLNLFIHVYQGKLNISIFPYLFGVDILQFAGISIVFFALLKRLKHSILISISISVVAAFLGHYLLNHTIDQVYLQYIASFFYGASYWSYFPVFPWISYSLLGYAFYQINKKYDLQIVFTPFIKIISGIIFVGFLIYSLRYAIRVSANLQEYYHHGILFFFWTFIFLIFYSLTIHELDQKLGNSSVFIYLKWLGKNVTAVYIIQWILIGNTATIIFKSVESPLILVLSFCGMLFLVSTLTYFYLKLKSYKKKEHKEYYF
ncbi:DUF1624 domain-containing protein [Polaribacter litorisediminis]|uniref:heparan-alpha-glucosaminide N-acetyltransferase domain-containing protein n=1 Tax=Polaribacter litorisediminis TaxID=1908341 RepID=UPI001CC1BA94|nr:heparan-alpha-glucosaminide N-acetyltransferase domain-containing protein [Polaribacter litorisediminis]UAM98812.1 DUF1624 domain-containing protein [Polaribacter litorisediminis]